MKNTNRFSNIAIMICFCLLVALLAKNSKAETSEQKLLIKLKNAANDKERVEIYNNMSLSISYKNAEKSITYAKKAISLAKKINDNNGWITGLCREALSTTYTGKHSEAKQLYKEAIKTSIDKDLKEALARSYETAGLCAKELGDYFSSVSFYSKALSIIKENDLDKKKLISLYGNMAGIYALLEQWDNAVKFYHKAFDMIENDVYHKMVALYNLAYTYNFKKDFKNSELYGKQLLKIAEVNNNKLFIAYANSSLGERFFSEYEERGNKKLLNKAKKHFLIAVNIQKKFDKNMTYTVFLVSIGKTLLEQKKHKEAFPYIQEAMEISQKLKFRENIIKTHYYISQVYKGMKKFDLTISHLEKNKELNEKLYKENLSKKVSQMMVRFDTLTKEYELEKTIAKNEFLKKEAKTNRYILIILSILSILFVFIIILLYIFYRSKKRIAEILKTLSRTDPLTKLLNRRAMHEGIRNEIQRYYRNANPFTLIISDIDHFKKFNDTYGHECGDMVLKKVSEIIKINIREIDYVSRWGGEEFLILLINSDLKRSEQVANKLRGLIAERKINWKDSVLNITMSFGIYEYSKEDPVDRCIANADEALYRAKEGGRNCVVISNKN